MFSLEYYTFNASRIGARFGKIETGSFKKSCLTLPLVIRLAGFERCICTYIRVNRSKLMPEHR